MSVLPIIRIQHRIQNIVDPLSNVHIEEFANTNVYQQFHDGVGSAKETSFLITNANASFGTPDITISRPADTVFGYVDRTILPDQYIRLSSLAVGDTIDRNSDLQLEFDTPGSRWINLELVQDLSDSRDNRTIETVRRHFLAAPQITVSRDDLSLLPRGWIILRYKKHQVHILNTEHQQRIAVVFETEQNVPLYLR